MYPHSPTTGAELTALRTRLYRPDPPAGAVEAYLAALRTAEPATPPPPLLPPPAAPRARSRALGAVAATGVLLVALVTATTLSRQASATVTTPPAVAAHLALPPVSGTPIGTLYGTAGTTGLFDADGSHAVVSVNCSGDGTLDLRIGDEPPVVLTCQRGGPALAMLPSSGPLHRFTVAVVRHGPVRWSIAVGAADLVAA